MRKNIKKWLKPVLFTAGGALVGLAYYYFVGWGCCKCKLIAGNSLFPYAKYAYLSEEFCLRQ